VEDNGMSTRDPASWPTDEQPRRWWRRCKAVSKEGFRCDRKVGHPAWHSKTRPTPYMYAMTWRPS
jgi:hypothetical protein